MTPALSHITKAILLLTAPLIAGRNSVATDLLTPGEYKRLARHLVEMQRNPADLLSTDSADLLQACQPVIETERIKRLLGRGFLLSQVVERWQARAIWVVSRADAEYPRRIKARLREDAPAVLYGCGDITLLESGGLAVVGSRHVDDALIDYTLTIGNLAARSNKTVVSGGAKGIDQAAMRGALESGGKVCGVLADSLEKIAMNREHRNLLIEGQMVLVSPYDPNAGFNVGNAMQRNKLIYALSDASLVVSSDLKKGGTWAGAVEQLDKLRLVPVYVRSTGKAQEGLEALQTKGALPWPNPQDREAFEATFNVAVSTNPSLKMAAQSLFSEDFSPLSLQTRHAIPDTVLVSEPSHEFTMSSPTLPDSQSEVGAVSESPFVTQASCIGTDKKVASLVAHDPAEALFVAVREIVQKVLLVAKGDAEVAETLNVSKTQASAWLKRLKAEGVVEKKGRLYIKQSDLFK